jgi:hypothetical protein
VRFLLVCLLFLSFNASAVTVTDLYQVKVPVGDQQETSRKLGMRQAFQQVLIKISGHQDVLNNPILAAANERAENYVQGFSYQQDGFDEQIYLQAWFSKTLIIPLMKKAHAPIWGENRPLLLNWLALEVPQTSQVETDSTRDFINKVNAAAKKDVDSGKSAHLILRGQRQLVSEQVSQWQKPFEQVFSDLGLPTMWPLADLEDQTNLSVNQLWWLLSDPINLASQRYQADANLAGKLQQGEDGIWLYDGVLFHAGIKKTISVTADSPKAVLAQAAASVSYYFADQFAIKSDPMNGRLGVRISISNVKNFTAYSQVLTYLKSITGVRLVEVGQINQESVQLYLNLEGSWDKVQRIINLDDKLTTLQDKEFKWTQ